MVTIKFAGLASDHATTSGDLAFGEFWRMQIGDKPHQSLRPPLNTLQRHRDQIGAQEGPRVESCSALAIYWRFSFLLCKTEQGHMLHLCCSTHVKHPTPTVSFHPRVCLLDIYHQSTQHLLPRRHRSAVLKQASFAVSSLTPPHHPSCLLPLQTLTACADFGSLLFSTNPLPDFPSFTNTQGFHRRRVGKEGGKRKKRQSVVRSAVTAHRRVIDCSENK